VKAHVQKPSGPFWKATFGGLFECLQCGSTNMYPAGISWLQYWRSNIVSIGNELVL
jgi:hypothetical protein